MNQSICSQCKSTLCSCGNLYRSWPAESLEQHIAMLQKVLAENRPAPEPEQGGIALELYNLARSVYPCGFSGPNSIPVEIEGQKLDLRIYRWNVAPAASYEFAFYPPGTCKARKRIEVSATGHVNPDMPVNIPPRDRLLDREPVFTWPTEAILRVLYAKVKAEQTHRACAVSAACEAAAA